VNRSFTPRTSDREGFTKALSDGVRGVGVRSVALLEDDAEASEDESDGTVDELEDVS
jgi:hypothetical protein